MTLIEHMKKEINFIKNQIKEGSSKNRRYLDGYVLTGLKKKLNILKECLSKLTDKD